MKRRTSKDLNTLLGVRFTNQLTDKDLGRKKWEWIVLPSGTGETLDMMQCVLDKNKRAMTGWRMTVTGLQYLIMWKNKGNEDEES